MTDVRLDFDQRADARRRRIDDRGARVERPLERPPTGDLFGARRGRGACGCSRPPANPRLRRPRPSRPAPRGRRRPAPDRRSANRSRPRDRAPLATPRRRSSRRRHRPRHPSPCRLPATMPATRPSVPGDARQAARRRADGTKEWRGRAPCRRWRSTTEASVSILRRGRPPENQHGPFRAANRFERARRAPPVAPDGSCARIVTGVAGQSVSRSSGVRRRRRRRSSPAREPLNERERRLEKRPPADPMQNRGRDDRKRHPARATIRMTEQPPLSRVPARLPFPRRAALLTPQYKGRRRRRLGS